MYAWWMLMRQILTWPKWEQNNTTADVIKCNKSDVKGAEKKNDRCYIYSGLYAKNNIANNLTSVRVDAISRTMRNYSSYKLT